MALLSGNDQKRWNLRRGGIWAVGSIIAAERELKTSGGGETLEFEAWWDLGGGQHHRSGKGAEDVW